MPVTLLKGIRFNELGPHPDLKETKKYKVLCVKNSQKDRRPPVAVQLPLAAEGYVQFKPDPSDSRTTLAGVQNRVGCKTPLLTRARLRELRRFTLKFCKKHFVPLSPDQDLGVEPWLQSCPYPKWRKDELRKIYNNMKPLGWKDCKVKAFVKDEFYPEIKHSRGIYSRTDRFKVEVGPIFRAIEREIFKHPAFIKKIPIADRPKYIRDLLEVEGARYGAADYTAFESHFVADLMQNVEFVVYRYMTKAHACHQEFSKLLDNVLAGDNVCVFKNFHVLLNATRMSGEMNTSLGNGITNLIMLNFLFSKIGVKEVKAVVEGDDSLFSHLAGRCPTVEMYKEYGFTIKMENTDDLSEASFCGLIFDRNDLINITDPVDALVTFGWAGKFYCRSNFRTRMKLLRCKSLSYAHQFPGCPILASLAKAGLRITRSFDIRHFVENDRGMCQWDRDKLRAAIERHSIVGVPDLPIPINTRLLMHRVFGITPEEQINVENYLDSYVSGPLAGPVLELIERSPHGKLWGEIFRQYCDVYHYQSEFEWRSHWSTCDAFTKGRWSLPQDVLERT